MSSPPLKAPRTVRWLSFIVVIVAIVIRLWPHATGAPASPGRAAIPVAQAPRVASSAPRFAASIGFRSRERLEEHFGKHGADVGAASADDYLRMAQALRDRPAGGDVLETVRADGVVSRFDRASGAFLAFDADGTIRTFFRPNDGERYFRRQAGRAHGAP